ncbi:PadR family transcriptional regulator [Flavobacterium sp. J27]|uniref:PadR family transcriptional regulator n=1 Tax=Flavobacterium sp. J27 TaxID=2060419 RepID=UPI0010300655|nr:PadR family transcriptional regulator [Flavobacterium sp. J27]
MDSLFVSKWQSQVKKGTLSFIILNILKRKQFYGYELIDQVKKITKIEMAEGTIYPLMNRLEKQGLISSKWVEKDSGVPRKYCELTNAGKQSLEEMNLYWEQLAFSITILQNK